MVYYFVTSPTGFLELVLQSENVLNHIKVYIVYRNLMSTAYHLCSMPALSKLSLKLKELSSYVCERHEFL